MKVRLLLIVLLSTVLLIAVLPAFANHQWSFIRASCDFTTNTVTFTANNSGGTGPGYYVSFYVDGSFLADVDFFTDSPPYPEAGEHQFSFSTPEFTSGVLVTLDAGNDLIETECIPLTTLVSDACSNPLPGDFAVRSIPAGAYAYYAPSDDASAGFVLPAGTWYTGNAENGFVEVWIACQAKSIFVPAASVAG